MEDVSQDDILDQLEENFSCAICNGVLICAKKVDCGHIFCSYCLDLFQSTTNQCPKCSQPINSSVLVPKIDSKIKVLFDYCSPELRRSYELAKESRSIKSDKRTQAIQELKTHLPADKKETTYAKSSKNFDEVCNCVCANIWDAPTLFGPGSFNNFQASNATNISPPSVRTARGSKTPRNNPSGEIRSKVIYKSKDTGTLHTVINCTQGAMIVEKSDEQKDIDSRRVDTLLGLYDGILQQSETGTGANGDSLVDNRILGSTTIYNSELAIYSKEIKIIKEKQNSEIETLLNEAKGVLELDDFVHKWTDQIEKEIIETEEINPIVSESQVELHSSVDSEVLEENLINDKLWKTSAQLITKYREQKQLVKPLSSSRITLDEINSDFNNLDVLKTPRGTNNLKTNYDADLEKLKWEELLLPPTPRSRNPGSKSSRGIDSGRLKEKAQKNFEVLRGGMKSSRDRTSNLSARYVDETFTLFTKIKQCKETLLDLKGNRSHAVENFMKSQKSSRIPSTSNKQQSQEELRLPAVIDHRYTPRRPKSRMKLTPTILPPLYNSVNLKSRPNSAI